MAPVNWSQFEQQRTGNLRSAVRRICIEIECAQCSWQLRGRCHFGHQGAGVTGLEEIKAELKTLWTALRKLSASLMWLTGSAHGVNAAATLAAPAPVTEYATPVPAVTLLQELQSPNARRTLMRSMTSHWRQ